MKSLETYIKYFSQLRRAPGGGWTESTLNRAPHKPILLLAVLDLVARGVITSPFIDMTGDLVELNELFNSYWRRIVPLGKTSSIAFPFTRLHNEAFWELVPCQGRIITQGIINNISNVSQLRKNALGARIEEDLFHLFQNNENRNVLRETLLRTCFSDQGRAELFDQAAINAEAYDYSKELTKKAHFPKLKEVMKTYRTAARDQGFRRIVVSSYDHRCAICGVRIVTPEGHTVVDAAHIIPWRKTQNDDIRNGMALCKLCHWSFDEGMMGLSDKYGVIVSRYISSNPNVPGFLMTLGDRGAILPKDPDVWPAIEYLAEHRQKWRL